MRRVFADSNVLFPFSVMDLLLALSEDGVHEVLWTDDLLDEWERVIVREQKRSQESAAQITKAVREFFTDSKVERDEYEHLIEEMPGKDADDHAHMAAAVTRQPCTILTRNVKDFPSAPLAKRGVRVTDPDTYLCEVVGELPDEVADTLIRLAAEKTRPTKTPHDLLDDLEHAGVPRFAGLVRRLLQALFICG
ncbi:MAG: PIN domain-containing protein [Acidimicrobiales bacterium]|nr:PIN domain-containing protein [Acidimicrobiales bacterium]